MSELLKDIALRRSVYGISDAMPVPDAQLESWLKELIHDMPTAFNMQSTRMVLLLGENHKKLWEIVLATLEKITPAQQFPRTQKKIAGFAAGHGTILYFDDTAVTTRYGEENPLFKDNFVGWATQQNGMLQFATWTLLAEQGVGASLQHYNPLIDDEVKATWQLPAAWKLFAQMPFGVKTTQPDEKEYEPIEERFFLFK